MDEHPLRDAQPREVSAAGIEGIEELIVRKVKPFDPLVLSGGDVSIEIVIAGYGKIRDTGV